MSKKHTFHSIFLHFFEIWGFGRLSQLRKFSQRKGDSHEKTLAHKPADKSEVERAQKSYHSPYYAKWMGKDAKIRQAATTARKMHRSETQSGIGQQTIPAPHSRQQAGKQRKDDVETDKDLLKAPHSPPW
eukprot:1952154-Amphidinium_carterae.1